MPNITESAQTICDRAGSFLTSWMNAQHIRNYTSRHPTSHGDLKWYKPSPGRYKCNVDASFSHSFNRVGLGMCIRDDKGCFVLAKTEWLSPLLELDLGEALGLLSALHWVRGFQ